MNLSKFTRACLRCTLRVLLVVLSDKLDTHTFPRSITQSSSPVSVPILSRLCHLVFLHICVCNFLVVLCHTSVDSFLTFFHPSLLQRRTLLLVTRRDGNCPSLTPSLSLVTFSVCRFVPEVPRLPTDNCICIMDKGGRPCDKTPVTMNRDHETDEKSNPEKRQKRTEDENCKRINFLGGHACTTVS